MTNEEKFKDNIDELLKSEYKEPFKIFKIERDILKFALKNGYKYITRDDSGFVKVHKEKPYLDFNEIDGFHWGIGKTMHLFDGLFDFVKWEGWEKSRPMLIKSILNDYILK